MLMHMINRPSMKALIAFLILGMFHACTYEYTHDLESIKQEVIAAEKTFATMAAVDGVPLAFSHFAAEDVVMLRGKSLIKGKREMKDYFALQTLTDVKLAWEPTFVDVAASGDMAYTYGPYTFSAKDTSGVMIADTGYFHTVWKRQPTGEWRFVWD